MRDVATLYARVAEHAATLPADAWVMATGYDDSKLDAPPTREGLDGVSGGRPVWMVHCSHHSGMVNTEAIRRTVRRTTTRVPYSPQSTVTSPTVRRSPAR